MIYTLDSSIVSSIIDSANDLCIHCDLLSQQHFDPHPLLFYTHFYHSPITNTSLSSIQQILQ